jgi:hypothetical protein
MGRKDLEWQDLERDFLAGQDLEREDLVLNAPGRG